MDSNYVFPCRVMWWFGQRDAGKEYSGLLFAGIQICKPCVGLFALACSWLQSTNVVEFTMDEEKRDE